MKTIQVIPFRKVTKALAIQFHTTPSQVAEIAEDAGVVLFFKTGRCYTHDSAMYMISDEDVRKLENALRECVAAGIALRQEEPKTFKRASLEEKVNWLKSQTSIEVEMIGSSKCIVTYKHGKPRTFNLQRSLKAIQEYFEYCYGRQPVEKQVVDPVEAPVEETVVQTEVVAEAVAETNKTFDSILSKNLDAYFDRFGID